MPTLQLHCSNATPPVKAWLRVGDRRVPAGVALDLAPGPQDVAIEVQLSLPTVHALGTVRTQVVLPAQGAAVLRLPAALALGQTMG